LLEADLLQSGLSLKHEDHFRNSDLPPTIVAGLVEMTIPAKPRAGTSDTA
jgi:hypothetical protein